MPGAGIIRNTGIIQGRALYEEIRYYTYGSLAKDTFVYYSVKLTFVNEFHVTWYSAKPKNIRRSTWLPCPHQYVHFSMVLIH